MSSPTVTYLDHAATAPPRREVLEAMWPYLTSTFANPASQHEPGEHARQALEGARRRVAEHLGARPSEIVFTSGGTEADNAAVKGIALATGHPRRVVTSAMDHPAVLESARWLQRFGYEHEILSVDAYGRVSPETLESALHRDSGSGSPALVSIQYANNEVGTVQDIPTLAEVAAAHGVPFHTDAVQAAGQLPLRVEELGVQAMSLAGHKLGTPKGIGVLYLRRRTPFEALLHGGGQQRGRRSGTENVAGAVGMAAALDLTVAEDTSALAGRRDEFIRRVEQNAGRAGRTQAHLTGDRRRRLPGHASFIMRGRSGESVLLDLQRRGISCSSSSACDTERHEPSRALLAMGYSPEEAQAAVRFTFGHRTPEEELLRAAELLTEA